jgi:DNA-binding LacI/PurR family transcriptional regulator
MAAFTTPPLTTVDQPTAEQGRRAAAMLLERIQGKAGDSPRRTSFACRLIVRASTVKVGATGSGTI